MTDSIHCPACNGPSMPEHPAGALAWRHTSACLIGSHEDGQAVADAEVLEDRASFVRDISESERILLGVLGWTGADRPGTKTFVSAITPAVRYRAWPQLHPPVTTPEGA